MKPHKPHRPALLRWPMNAFLDSPRRHSVDPPVLRFSPLAWLKLAYLCHAGQTEVGGFGISSDCDLLYVDQVETLLQGATAVSLEFSDSSVADHFDRFADSGIPPARSGRIWIHTHPGASANPSSVDEETFARVFGPCDWAIMFILSRTGQTYARLRFSAGPGGQMLLPVAVDWSAWPDLLEEQGEVLPELVRQWRHEYDSNVFDVSTLRSPLTRSSQMQPLDLDDYTGLYELDQELDALAISAFRQEVGHDG